jgi:glycosyltransferase involved in cell wall biosynthesis
LNILQIIPLFSHSFGGAPEVVRNISKELARAGHEVSVYTTTRCDPSTDFSPQEELVEGYHVFRFKRNLRIGLIGDLNISFDLMKAVQKNLKEFDIVHLHSWRQFEDYIICKYAPKNSVPYILQVHGTLANTNKRAIKQVHKIFCGRGVLSQASGVVAISPAESVQFQNMGVPSEKIKIIYNGLDAEKYSKLPPRGNFRKQNKLAENVRIVLYLGRLDPTKGVDFVIESFAFLVRKKGLRNVLLAICGPDFGFLSEACILIKQYGLSNKVLLCGALSEEDKISAYVDADIVVYPELFNVWGLVVTEAAACGKPVIVSEGNFMANVVNKGKFGFVVKYGAVEALATLLERCLNDKDDLKRRGLLGRQFVLENFSWRSSVQELERLYSEIASNRS